jgi:hypothetical protein
MNNFFRAAATVAALAGSLAACGLAPASSSSSPSPGAGEQAQAGDPGTGGENAFLYDNNRFHYRVAAPGVMADKADGSAAFTGQVERLEIHVVSGTPAADSSGLANADLAQLRSSAGSFRLESGVQQLQLSGRQVTKFVYSWVDGTSPVTGKPVSLVTARYYIPRDSSMIAVLTYSSVSSQYDPQGADDIAMTFQWR